MKILLAPSETKSQGGSEIFSLENLFGPSLFDIRKELIANYQESIKTVEKSTLMFGLKKSQEIEYYRQIALESPAKKAVLRYTGVAFDYLDYQSLDFQSQNYLDKHLLIFSNLFGVLRACDLIPEYRVAQGAKIGDIQVDKRYKKEITKTLDEYLADEDILDIRAGYYDKFYTPNKPYTTLKFLKRGKVVSHWAKAYRGKVLREVAKNKIENITDFIALPIDGLSLVEVQKRKLKTEIIYEIGD
ncbi:MAG TPA: YaaA family protein [Epsilonproteobacteria bacterium]|nr:YaaA family protein [Campylobacterota bacterium]